MPIPPANLYPPFNIVRLSHIELCITDLAAARRFYVDTLGLQISHEDTGRFICGPWKSAGITVLF